MDQKNYGSEERDALGGSVRDVEKEMDPKREPGFKRTMGSRGVSPVPQAASAHASRP